MFTLGNWFNVGLAKEPMNWAIVWMMATLSLLLFHVVMVGFGAMQGSQDTFGGPGQIASPVDATHAFAIGGSNVTGNDLPAFAGGGPQIWTDGTESRYAEDGFTYNF
jgi:hypothetical protein